MSSPITPTENSTGAKAVMDFIVARMEALGFQRAEDPVVTSAQEAEARSVFDRTWQFAEFNFTTNHPISGQTDRVDSVVIQVNYLHRGNQWPAMGTALVDSDRIQAEFLNQWEDANVQTGGSVLLEGEHLKLLLSWQFPSEFVFNEDVEF